MNAGMELQGADVIEKKLVVVHTAFSRLNHNSIFSSAITDS